MAGFKKTPYEKFSTRLNHITSEDLEDDNGNIHLGDDVFMSYDENEVSFSKKRYYPNSIINVAEDDFTVIVPLTHDNLKYISTYGPNPPKYSGPLIRLMQDVSGNNINSIVIGADDNSLDGDVLSVTNTLYDDFVKINREEGSKKAVRVKNRMRVFLNEGYNLAMEIAQEDKDYNLLLREVINSGKVDQQDIIALSAELEEGVHTQVVIEKQVNKQVKWLIETIEKILEEDTLTKPRAQELGKQFFGYYKKDISGPEHLMEKILGQYGQATLFGVPALLNTDKYVQHDGDLSRSQFDLILITHLGDVEVVELKRPDEFLLKCDFSRKKFYPTKDLSIAISQSERYITTVLKDNDEDYKIKGKKIRDYLNDEVGGTMFIETVRPKALIIIGSYKTLYKPYDKLTAGNKAKITKEAYETNGDRAYAEIKGSFKNINVLTYSELLEHARTRLELIVDDNENQDPEDEQIVL
jgi:hypothetical protein